MTVCVEPTQEHRRICNDGVPSSCCLCRVGEVGISVQFITPPLPARFVKLVSARFPVLQTITRTELYVVSC